MDIAAYLRERHGIPLSRQQTEAIETTGGHILLLAVPGAGKTTVVTAHLAELILNHGVSPDRILTLTYNRESALDMTRRWESLFGGLTSQAPKISTIHSFCLGLLREYALERGTRVPGLLEGEGSGEKSRIIAAIYREETGGYLTEETLSDLINAMGYCVNMHLGERQVEALGKELPDFLPVYRRYTAYKREHHLMDFDDMLLFAYTALARNPAFRERVAGGADYVHVDEAQDTSKIQHEILSLIVRDNLLMVGDEDQSIYGFRGAFPRGLTDFFGTYPDGRLMKLEENFRSIGAIVAGASKVIEGNKERHRKTMRTAHAQGKEIEIVRELDMAEEGEWIARRLSTLPPEESCAVLYRTGFSGVGLAHVLHKQGIGFSARQSGLRYAGDFICRDILSIMALAEDPSDAKAFTRCYFRLGCGIPRDEAAKAAEHARGDILDWIIEHSNYPGKNTGRLGWTRRVLAKMAGKPPAKQMEIILGELEYLMALEKRGQGGYQMNGSLQKLAILHQFARDADRLDTLIKMVEGAENKLNSNTSNRIFLSTVHSAKGREFDRVIIADALEGIFPITDAVEYSALGQRELLEEETRLFYTAMTRAKSRLTILAPNSALGRSLYPSRFLQPLDINVYRVGEVVLAPGQWVSHMSFGMGQIVKLDPRRGRAEVRFQIGGDKTFLLDSFADPKIFHFL